MAVYSGGAAGETAPLEKSKFLIFINLLILNIDYCWYSQKHSAELRRTTWARCFETHVWVRSWFETHVWVEHENHCPTASPAKTTYVRRCNKSRVSPPGHPPCESGPVHSQRTKTKTGPVLFHSKLQESFFTGL